MFSQDTLEEKFKANSKKIKELEIRHEMLNQEINDFLKDLEVTSQQIELFTSNKDNFTEENWEELQKQKKQLDEKLQIDLSNIRNPLKVKKSYAGLNIAQHWLFVK